MKVKRVKVCENYSEISKGSLGTPSGTWNGKSILMASLIKYIEEETNLSL